LKTNIVVSLCLTSLLLVPSSVLHSLESASTAQQSSPSAKRTPTADEVSDSYIQLMRADIRSERKKIVAANLPLTEDEATKLWPFYDRYIGETIKVNDNRYALIKEYVAESRQWNRLAPHLRQTRLTPNTRRQASPKSRQFFRMLKQK
jgi:hypothetical protein